MTRRGEAQALSAPSGILAVVVTIAEFIEQSFDTPVYWPTGITGLDDLVGGMGPGRVWLVTGAPGQGKSTLLTQLAFRMAVEHGASVLFASPLDDADLVRARLLALARVGSLRYPDPGVAGANSTSSVDALRRSALEVQAGGGFSGPMWAESESRPRCWVVDDAHYAGLAFSADLRTAAGAGAFVLASLPRENVVTGPRWGDVLVQQWASTADVILEIQGDPPEDGHLPGDARLLVHRNRRGPCLDIPLANQVWRGRFVDPAR